MGERLTSRKWIKTPVKLYNPVFGEFSGITHDISDSGIFIEIEPFIGLDMETEQKLVFLNSANRRVIFNVHFIRATEQGVAFRFVDYETAGTRFPLSDLRNIWKIHQASRTAVA